LVPQIKIIILSDFSKPPALVVKMKVLQYGLRGRNSLTCVLPDAKNILFALALTGTGYVECAFSSDIFVNQMYDISTGPEFLGKVPDSHEKFVWDVQSDLSISLDSDSQPLVSRSLNQACVDDDGFVFSYVDKVYEDQMAFSCAEISDLKPTSVRNRACMKNFRYGSAGKTELRLICSRSCDYECGSAPTTSVCGYNNREVKFTYFRKEDDGSKTRVKGCRRVWAMTSQQITRACKKKVKVKGERIRQKISTICFCNGPCETESPTHSPTESPTKLPTESQTVSPAKSPTHSPTKSLTKPPTFLSSSLSTNSPSSPPSNLPSSLPSDLPSSLPRNSPSSLPSNSPSFLPLNLPSSLPSKSPTHSPTKSLTKPPTFLPSSLLTNLPSSPPSNLPTSLPSDLPTSLPLNSPSSLPSNSPSFLPLNLPSSLPSYSLSSMPSHSSSSLPSSLPSYLPSSLPSTSSKPSITLTKAPTSSPSVTTLGTSLFSVWDGVQCPAEDTETITKPAVGELVLIPGAVVLSDLSVCMAISLTNLPDVIDASAKLTVSGFTVISVGADKPLVLQMSGTVFTSRDVVLQMSTTRPWKPLPTLLPDFLMPNLMGTLTGDTDGSMSVQARAKQVSSFSLAGVLEFNNWEGTLSLETPDTQVKFGAAGTMVIGGTNGFSVKALAELDLVNGSLSATATHSGGWQPFPSLLPSFSSPEFEAALNLNSGGLISFKAFVTAPSPIMLFDTSLMLTGKDGIAGPIFGVDLSRKDSTAKPSFAAYFEAEVSISFGTQIDLHVRTGLDCSRKQIGTPRTSPRTSDDTGCSFTLVADYTEGNIKPLEAVTSLPKEVQNALTIHADEVSPARFVLDVSTSPYALSFQVSSTFSVNIGEWGFISGRMEAMGGLEDGHVAGYFIGKVDTPPLFATRSDGSNTLSGITGSMYVSVATSEVASVSFPGESWLLDVPEGLALSYSGPSIMPLICSDNTTVSIAYTSADSMALSTKCDIDLLAEVNTLGITHFAFRMLTIKADISPTSVGFGLTASFEIATHSSLGYSNCKEPDTEAACLTIDLTASISFITIQPPSGKSIVIDFNAAMRGNWMEPLGLRNFAIASPSIGLGIQIYAPGDFLHPPTWMALPHCISQTGVPLPCAQLKRFEWGVTIYWKRTGIWPSALRVKQKGKEHPCPDGPSGVPAEPRDCFPESDLVTMRSHFVYEKTPHDDILLSSLGLPRLGLDLVLTEISLYDILAMGLDIASWISKTSGNGVVDPLKLPEGVDDFLKEVKFGFNVQLSLIEEGVFQRGLYLFGKAQANFASLGNFSFMFEAELRLRSSDNALVEFSKDPLSALRAKMEFNATVTLPTIGDYHLGEAMFYGLIEPTRFQMNATVQIGNIAGFNFEFLVGLIASEAGFDTLLYSSTDLGKFVGVELFGRLSSDPSIGLQVDGKVDISLGGIDVEGTLEIRLNALEVFLQVKGAIDLGILGDASVVGTIDAETGQASLQVAVNTSIFGFQICGHLYSKVKVGKYLLSANLLLRLGFMGDYYLTGEVSDDGVKFHALGSTDGGIKQAIKDGVNAILGETPEPIKDAISDAFGSTFGLNSVEIMLDTRKTSEDQKMKLQINMTILGVSIDFSIHINLNRRRRAIESSIPVFSNKLKDLEPLWGGHQPPRLMTHRAENLVRHRQLTNDQLDEICAGEDDGFTVSDFIEAMKDVLDSSTVIGWLGVCPEIDSSRGCESNEFCAGPLFKCESRRDTGDVCSNKNACKSGKCDAGFCVNCYRDGTGCTSSQYCDLGRCKTTHGFRHPCVENRVCKSGKCDGVFCVNCYRSGLGCSSSQYCDLGNCKTKHDFRHICAENRVCKSGVCAGTCTTNSCRGHVCPFGDDYGAFGRDKCCKNTPKVCTPRVCTPRVCTPNCIEVCTPKICAPRVCGPKFFGKQTCWGGGCTPKNCVDQCGPELCVGGGCTPASCVGGGTNSRDCC